MDTGNFENKTTEENDKGLTISNSQNTENTAHGTQNAQYGVQNDQNAAHGMQNAQYGVQNNQNAAYGTQNTQYGAQNANIRTQNMSYASQDARVLSQAQRNPEPRKKKGGVFKKIMLGVAIGLCVGVFAYVGFLLMMGATDFLKDKIGKTESAKEESVIQKFTDRLKGNESVDEKEENAEADGSDVNQTGEEQEVEKASLVTVPAQTVVTDVTEVVKETMPAVVSVNNKHYQTVNFFGQTYSQESEGAGSGIIIAQNDTELLIVTNNHVVNGAAELTITFVDDKQAPAQIKGVEPDRDVAVVAVLIEDIDEDTLNSIKIAQIGDSDALIVGEPVVAIGNSLGYGQSVTTGVVSALNRVFVEDGGPIPEDIDEDVPTFIQTDAAINPGNSGGALLNMYGQVIGINSSKYSGVVVEGMGYAIPISSVKPIIENLMNKQTRLLVSEEKQGYLGITGVDVEEQYSEIYGIPIGVFISAVEEGSGAEKAGIIKGDIITELDGTKVKSITELRDMLDHYEVGESVEVKLLRGNAAEYEENTVTVVLGKKPVTTK